MVQSNDVLTGEVNRNSLISARRTTTQENYPLVAETAIPVSETEQAWVFKPGEPTYIHRTAPELLNPFVKIVNWLNHLGSGKIDDSCLESRHNIHHNFSINGIGR